jgi:hypothetical protein
LGSLEVEIKRSEPVRQTYSATVGTDSVVLPLTVDGSEAMVRVWDTSGQERYASICGNMYKSAHVILLAFDLTDEKTLSGDGGASSRLATLLTARPSDNEGPPTLLWIGMKRDLSSQRIFPREKDTMLKLIRAAEEKAAGGDSDLVGRLVGWQQSSGEENYVEVSRDMQPSLLRKLTLQDTVESALRARHLAVCMKGQAAAGPCSCKRRAALRSRIQLDEPGEPELGCCG